MVLVDIVLSGCCLVLCLCVFWFSITIYIGGESNINFVGLQRTIYE